ncbi:MAG: HD domain-containing protein [Chloroflexota bacterium]|nr:MAG: HD domain-containing protein [Chloroflexota bacterium]
MDNTRLSQQSQFLLEIDRLKNVIRRSILTGVDRRENSAEHSWHLAVMALVLAEHSDEPVDVTRVVKMLLVHDLVEIDAGDTYCYDPSAVIDQSMREHQAAARIFGLLPDDQAGELHMLWKEFEARQTPDALFANTLDRLMPLLHNYYTQGRTWKDNDINRSQVLFRNQPAEEISQTIWEFSKELIEDAVSKGYLKG